MKPLLTLVLLMAGLGAALAADLPVPGKPAQPKKVCRWVSDCEICARGPDGRLVCSTVGIACQPKRQRCVAD
jgi:hypothetical protein